VTHWALIPWFKLEPWHIPLPLIEKIPLQPFGLLVAIGIIFGSYVAEWRGEKTGVPRQAVADFLVYTIVIGLLSAMLFNVVVYEPRKLLDMLHGKFSYPGLSSYGGFLGGVLTALWFRQKKRMSIFVLGDVWCFAFPFAWVFGRTGCFVVHDHPGIESDFFLAVDNYNLEGVPRHDLGLYEVLWSLAAIGLFLWLGRKPRPRGYFMAVCPLFYAPIRFGLDFLREGEAYGGDVRYFGLTPGHYGSMALLAAGLAVAWRVWTGPEVSLHLDAPPAGTSEPPRGRKPGERTTLRGRRSAKRRSGAEE
jgi:phosphatidylglycerol:prolipoprotein diacylglycerol transferase